MPALLSFIFLFAAFLVVTPAALGWLVLLAFVFFVCAFNAHCMAMVMFVGFGVFYLSNF